PPSPTRRSSDLAATMVRTATSALGRSVIALDRAGHHLGGCVHGDRARGQLTLLLQLVIHGGGERNGRCLLSDERAGGEDSQPSEEVQYLYSHGGHLIGHWRCAESG